VNDTFGHLAGDRVLVTLGRLLATRFRAEDVRGRWGGEEFLVAFPGEPCEVAEGLVLRVLRELRETRFAGDQGEAFHITFSAGVASYPEDGLTVESLLKTADRRLYHAKRAGKTAWCAGQLDRDVPAPEPEHGSSRATESAVPCGRLSAVRAFSSAASAPGAPRA